MHGILGENGAGKSTLMKILAGMLAPDGGTILLDGTPVRFRSAGDAIAAGVGMVHQDPLDFPALTVLDNFLLGAAAARVRGRRAGRETLLEFTRRFGFALDPDARCDQLTVGERQQLEIVRLLWLGVRVLILDEPTTAISLPQRVQLFAALRAMTAQAGVVLFVSHKIEEVEELCGRVTVLRRGRVAGETAVPAGPAELVHLMFGRALPRQARTSVAIGPPALELTGASVGDALVTLAPLTLTVGAGEVVGLAGLEGSGQRLLLRACAGLTRPVEGRIAVAGRDLTGRPYARFLAAGVAYVPAGRLGEGLIPGLTVAEHVALAQPKTSVAVDHRAARETAGRRIRELDIRGTPDTDVQSLSGGNQQRVLLALLPERVTVLLMEHPTRGLDVESAEEIWRRLLERREHGTAVMFSSSDVEELLERSDRILVFSGARVAPPLDARRATVDDVGALIAGAGL
jgi:general nucleoside transport system ATP-binding protein